MSICSATHHNVTYGNIGGFNVVTKKIEEPYFQVTAQGIKVSV